MLPWREQCQHAIEAQMGDDQDWPMLGPVTVMVTFTVKKPASRPKRRRSWPITRPDIDKLARCALDALTNSGSIRDDSQVIFLMARKTYPGEGPYALPVPGMVLHLQRGEW
jgi:Holliday junction resolvase RusA-like endonuclease